MKVQQTNSTSTGTTVVVNVIQIVHVQILYNIEIITDNKSRSTMILIIITGNISKYYRLQLHRKLILIMIIMHMTINDIIIIIDE